jgi:hypothetical protein
MTRGQLGLGRRLGTALVIGILITLPGCGTGDTLPVSGQVTVDGEPLQAPGGVVIFKPDADKGNTSKVEPTGYLDDQGRYTLYSAPGKKGAAPGWYKVQVNATKLGPKMPMPKPHRPGTPDPPPPPKGYFDNKFTSSKTSGLNVEVVADPPAGAYDLILTK